MNNLIERYWKTDKRGISWKGVLVPNVMLRRIYPADLLRANKSGMALFIACALLRSSGMLDYVQFGEASWYGPGFHGMRSASGEIFDSNKMTAAHPSLPLGTKVEVTNLEKDKKVQVRIIDRGPYVQGRVIDLSRAAAKKLGMVKDGTAEVKIVMANAVKKQSL